jgi:hypothetical protein
VGSLSITTIHHSLLQELHVLNPTPYCRTAIGSLDLGEVHSPVGVPRIGREIERLLESGKIQALYRQQNFRKINTSIYWGPIAGAAFLKRPNSVFIAT